MTKYKITGTFTVEAIDETPPIDPPDPAPTGKVRLTDDPAQEYCHSDSGWSTGVIDENHLAVHTEGKWYSVEFDDEGEEVQVTTLPEGVGYGGQVIQRNGEYLRIDNDGVLWAGGDVLGQYPSETIGKFRLLHNATGTASRYVWASQRGASWWAGWLDTYTGETFWEPSPWWQPNASGSNTDRWHEFHSDGEFGIVIPSRLNAAAYDGRPWMWMAREEEPAMARMNSEMSHLALNGDLSAYSEWDDSTSPWRHWTPLGLPEAEVVYTPGEAPYVAYNHYYIMEWKGSTWWCASKYAKEGGWQELLSIDVYNRLNLVVSIPASRQLQGDWGQAFMNHARPFLWNRGDKLWAVWHSDEANEPGLTDVWGYQLPAPEGGRP